MGRDIRLHYERVVLVACVLAAALPLYFLLTGFAVPGPDQRPLGCAATVVELGRGQATATDPTGACYVGAVQRLHLAGGYCAAGIGVAVAVWLFAGARERALNRAWASARPRSRWMSTSGEVWLYAALLFVVFAGAAQSGL
jgi:hypothetical protein